MLDTTTPCETPEGVDLQLHLAGPMVRAQAWLYDLVIRAVAYAAVTGLLSYLGRFGMGMASILIFLVEWLYPFFFELTRGGATPGKKAMGLYAVQDNGAPLEWRSALLRNLLRAVDFVPLFYGLGLASMVVNGRFQRLGDLAAGTLVVYRTGPGETPTAAEGAATAPPVPLGLAEQQALLAFAERSPGLSDPRRAELAGILAPLTGDQADAVAALHRYANWYRGSAPTQAEDSP